MEIKIRRPFTDQYTLIVESNLMAVDMHLTSKAKMRWDFNVLRTSDQYIEVRLILLENNMIESNNPMIRDVAKVSQLFSRMYNELHLILSHSGEVLEVLNEEIIKDKWKRTKKEMMDALQNPSVKDVIHLNDGIFSSSAKIRTAIQANEFLSVFFGYVYGRKIPSTQSVEKPNFFNTTYLDWIFSIKINKGAENEDEIVKVNCKGEPAFFLTRLFYSNAYSQFADKIKIHNLRTKLKEESHCHIDVQTGRLIWADIIRNEIADSEKLYVEYVYFLMCNDVYKEKMFGNVPDMVDEFAENRVYKVYNGINYTKEEWEEKVANPWHPINEDE